MDFTILEGILAELESTGCFLSQCHFCTICFDELFSGDQTRDTTGHLVLQFEVAYYFYGIGKPFEAPSEMTSRSGFLPILRVSKRNQILEGSE
ncbi:hypothetical protein TWF706_003343 [Orbilia oligospora]|nr:hypothetical protein TWF706_003343 [Orbilia oligospora]